MQQRLDEQQIGSHPAFSDNLHVFKVDGIYGRGKGRGSLWEPSWKSDMSRFTPSQRTGNFGEKYVGDIVETGWGGVVLPMRGSKDRGYDGLVLDVHRNALTGLDFFYQVRTLSKQPASDTFGVRVNKRHLDLWRNSNVPVVLIHVAPGPPPRAFWHLMLPEEETENIRMRKRDVFGPDSRDTVVAEIRSVSQAFRKAIPPERGRLLKCPLQVGLRDWAKDYYYRELKGKSQDHSMSGPVEFTWKGWRHLTRKPRALQHIRSSLSLLPCIRAVLDSRVQAKNPRNLYPVRRGGRVQYRTLLSFERVIIFPHRAPAWVRVVVERQLILPTEWAISPPDDRRRELRYKFLSVYELARPVTELAGCL